MEQDNIQHFYEEAEANKDLLHDIFISVPVRPHDGVCIRLAKALSIWATAGVHWSALSDSMGGFIEITRTRMVLHFLNERSEKYLLMIDNDTEPCLRLPYLLARHGEAVVGSCIPSFDRTGRSMLCFSRRDSCGIARMIDYTEGAPVPALGLVEVPSVGTGAMLIRRDVLESFTLTGLDAHKKAFDAMKEGRSETLDPDELRALVDADIPFFIPQHIRWRGAVDGAIMRGEDLVFCSKAKEKGFKIHVDLEAHCDHRKTMALSFPEELRDPSLGADDWCAPVTGMMLSE